MRLRPGPVLSWMPDAMPQPASLPPRTSPGARLLRAGVPAIESRRSSASLVAIVVVAATAGITATNALAFSRADSVVWQWHAATGGWINPNLVLFLPLTALIVGGLIIAKGGLRLADLGLAPGWVARLAGLLLAGWLAANALAVIATILAGAPVEYHGSWQEHGAGNVVGLFAAMVLGTALFEETVFRGYLLPQLHFALSGRIAGERLRLAAALVGSAAIFALWHLPTILLNSSAGLAAIFGALAYMMLGGILLSLLYLRTARLEVAIAGHALVNAPTLIVASPVSGSLLAGVVGVAAILAGPLLVGRNHSFSLARPVAV